MISWLHCRPMVAALLEYQNELSVLKVPVHLPVIALASVAPTASVATAAPQAAAAFSAQAMMTEALEMAPRAGGESASAKLLRVLHAWRGAFFAASRARGIRRLHALQAALDAQKHRLWRR